MATVDLELKKAFQELQMQVLETRTKMRQIDSQIELTKRSSQHTKFTSTEVQSLPDDTVTFESCGRVFIKRDRKDITELLDGRIKANVEKVKTLEQNKSYLESNVKESENNLRELIAQKQRISH